MIARAVLLVLAVGGCDRVFGLDRDLSIDAPIIGTEVPVVCSLSLGTPINLAPALVAIAAGELTGDTNVDLAVVSNAAGTVIILEGKGDGTFDVGPQMSTGGTGPQGVAIADFDRDGRDDIVVSNLVSNTLNVLFARPPGWSPTIIGAFSNPGALAVGLLDGNALPDFAVANEGNGQIGVHFAAAFGSIPLATPDSPRALAVANVDGAERDDVIGASANGTARIFLSNASGGFSPNPATLMVGLNPRAVVAGKFNSGPELDLAFVSLTTENVQVFLNDGNGSFSTAGMSLMVGADPVAMVAVDITQDGFVDLVTANSGNSTLTILAGSAVGTFGTRNDIPSGTTPSGLVTADFDGDMRPDLAVANGAAGTVTVLLNRCVP